MIAYHRLSPDDLAACIRVDLEEVEQHYVTLGVAQLRWCPDPARWSVGQCLHHLVVTDRLYLDRLRPAVDEARHNGRLGEGPHEGGRFGRWFTAQVGPQVALRLNAPRSIAPRRAATIDADVADMFVQNGRRLLALIDEARGLDLDRVRIGWPILPLVRLRVIDALRAVVAHDRRHLDQARRVTQAAGFPDGTYAGG